MAKRTGERLSGGNRGSRPYIPDAGHLVWLSISPQAGREQGARRPGLVLSPHIYNANAGLCVVCPITSQVKNYPFEVTLPDGLAIAGVILCDHVKSADWRARDVEYVDVAPAEIVVEVRAKLKPLLGI